MSRRNDDALMRDMLEYAEAALRAIQERTRQDLDSDPVLRAAVERFVQVVGEAANRVSSETRRKLGALPWAEIIGMRNRLVHGYTKIDCDVLWRTIHEDIPKLIAELETALGK